MMAVSKLRKMSLRCGISGPPTTLAIPAAMLALTASLHAQDTITNVMSPVASYQFYDTLGAETNSPVVSPVAGYQYYDALNEFGTNSPIVSFIAAYQFYDVLNDMGTNSIIMSPVPAYYYGPDGIHFLGLALADGIPQITLSAAAGQVYTVQFSTNLVDWTPLTTVTFAFPDLLTQFSVDISTNGPLGFYRVVGP